MTLVPIHNIGAIGVVSDRPAHTLPPEVWTDSRNMRFIRKQAYRMKGHSAVLGTPSVAPGFVFNVPGAGGASFWLYGNTQHVYVNDGGVHTQITRSAGASPYTAANLWDWNLCLIGGVPVLNNGADVPQYWPTLSAGTDLADLSNWTSYPVAGFRAKVVRSFGEFLVALNITTSAGLAPHRVVWSSKADPGTVPASWNVNDPTVDTGQRDLTDVISGAIRDGLILGNQFYIYKEAATHVMRFVGGQDIMAFDFVLNTGILATRCVCLIDRGRRHFVVTEDDVIFHRGSKETHESVVEEKDRETIFTELNQAARDTCFVFDSAQTNEAFFCYPTSGATKPNKAFVWNYKYNTVYFRSWNGLDVGYGAIVDASGVTWATVVGSWDTIDGPWNVVGGKALVIADPDLTKFYQLELGDSYGSSVVTSFLERTGLAIVGRDRQGEPKVDYEAIKQISRVWLKIRGAGAANVQVQIGAQEEIDGAVTWTLPKFFNPAAKYLDFDEEEGVTGRLNAIRLLSSVDAHWQLEGYSLEVNVISQGGGVA